MGEIKGINKPILGMEIQKVGFVTGLSFGEIKTVGVTTDVDISDDKEAHYQDLILSDNLYNEAGDSGAVILDNDNNVVGLFMAGVDSYAFFPDIKKVIDEFKIDVYLGG